MILTRPAFATYMSVLSHMNDVILQLMDAI